MNTGKTLFAQIMVFLPWSSFDRIVARYDGNRGVRKLSCVAQYQIMAFAQLTYRESLRDIEACLSAQRAKLYHIGFREPVRRSTLADANELRDWRIYAEFAQRLIIQARRLYANESLEVDLADSVYVLDSTTIDLCMSVFPWPICGPPSMPQRRRGVRRKDAHAARSARKYPQFHRYLGRQAARCSRA
jgi:hypothetical protein